MRKKGRRIAPSPDTWWAYAGCGHLLNHRYRPDALGKSQRKQEVKTSFDRPTRQRLHAGNEFDGLGQPTEKSKRGRKEEGKLW